MKFNAPIKYYFYGYIHRVMIAIMIVLLLIMVVMLLSIGNIVAGIVLSTLTLLIYYWNRSTLISWVESIEDNKIILRSAEHKYEYSLDSIRRVKKHLTFSMDKHYLMWINVKTNKFFSIKRHAIFSDEQELIKDWFVHNNIKMINFLDVDR